MYHEILHRNRPPAVHPLAVARPLLEVKGDEATAREIAGRAGGGSVIWRSLCSLKKGRSAQQRSRQPDRPLPRHGLRRAWGQWTLRPATALRAGQGTQSGCHSLLHGAAYNSQGNSAQAQEIAV